jgi:hypothetical protein
MFFNNSFPDHGLWFHSLMLIELFAYSDVDPLYFFECGAHPIDFVGKIPPLVDFLNKKIDFLDFIDFLKKEEEEEPQNLNFSDFVNTEWVFVFYFIFFLFSSLKFGVSNVIMFLIYVSGLLFVFLYFIYVIVEFIRSLYFFVLFVNFHIVDSITLCFFFLIEFSKMPRAFDYNYIFFT